MFLSSSITILAQLFNPSIFTAEWLKNRTAIKDFSNEVVLPVVSINASERFNVICEPDKLQLTQNDPTQSTKELCQLAEDIINHLPETPYKAVGINFQYQQKYSDIKLLGEFLLERINIRPIPGFIENNDQDFLPYIDLIKNIEGSLLTFKALTMKKDQQHILIVNFNFHHDQNDYQKIIDIIHQHSKYHKKALDILKSFLS